MARITLNIAKSYSNFISEFESSKYFQLQKNSTTRADLFCFAISICLMEKAEPTPISSVGASDTFVRVEYISNYEPFLSALYFKDNIADDTDKIDDICNRDDVYSLAEMYANTGFGILKKWRETIDEETLLYKFMNFLDSQYSSIYDELKTILAV